MPSSKAGGSKNPSLQDTEEVTIRKIKMINKQKLTHEGIEANYFLQCFDPKPYSYSIQLNPRP